jgi:hypothetical protein
MVTETLCATHQNSGRKQSKHGLARTSFAALRESAIGTKQTSNSRPLMSAFGGKADIAISERDVRF